MRAPSTTSLDPGRIVADSSAAFAERPIYSHLIALKPDRPVGQWRDSNEGIGRGRVSTAELLEKAFPGLDDPGRHAMTAPDAEAPSLVAGGEMTAGVTMHLAECCSPLPGDRIVGVLIPERGIEVHVIDCARLADYENQADSWLDLRWKPKLREKRMARTRGSLADNSASNRHVASSEWLSENTNSRSQRSAISSPKATRRGHNVAGRASRNSPCRSGYR